MPEIRGLLDACVGYVTETALVAVGPDVATMLTIQPEMPDAQVLSLANRENRLLITLDRKISDLVFVHGLPHAGILLVREPHLPGSERAGLTPDVVKRRYTEMLGRFSSLCGGRLRIHRGRARE